MLFNKRQNGILMFEIFEKNNSIIPKVDEFPKYNGNYISKDHLEFNIYNQRLSFNSSHTKDCEKGCFLKITYYSNISKNLEIDGTEFSILNRIWDEEEFNPQITNIPLNEYIFSYFDETTVNNHFYSIFIPYETNNIFIEIHGKNILGYFKEGIIKINTQKISDGTKKLFDKCEEKMIIKLNKDDSELNSFKGKYISFAFRKDINDNYSFYYFRILHQNLINYMIYPLDTNKENFCETNNKKCYFLLKNEYNDYSNKIVIYGYGENDVSYNAFYMNETDYYSENLNLDNLNKIKEIESFNGYLSLDLKANEHFVLVEIESNAIENKYLTIITSFYSQSNSSSIDIYSYQLYYLSESLLQQFDLYQNPLLKYRILINNTKGEGIICFKKIYDNNNNFIYFEKQRIYSFSISNKTNFFIKANTNLTFKAKIIYDISNKVIKELNYQHNFDSIDSNKEEAFPLIYFIKDVKYNGININFNFKFDIIDNIYNNLIIKGYGLDYSEISLIKNKKDINNIDFPNEIKGKYDNITNSGSIELSNEFIKTKHNEN